jgi:hypothetical protein
MDATVYLAAASWPTWKRQLLDLLDSLYRLRSDRVTVSVVVGQDRRQSEPLTIELLKQRRIIDLDSQTSVVDLTSDTWRTFYKCDHPDFHCTEKRLDRVIRLLPASILADLNIARDQVGLEGHCWVSNRPESWLDLVVEVGLNGPKNWPLQMKRHYLTIPTDLGSIEDLPKVDSGFYVQFEAVQSSIDVIDWLLSSSQQDDSYNEWENELKQLETQNKLDEEKEIPTRERPYYQHLCYLRRKLKKKKTKCPTD